MYRPKSRVSGKFERPVCRGEVSDRRYLAGPLIGYRFKTPSLPVAGLECTGWRRVSSEMGGGIIVRCFVASDGITLQRVHSRAGRDVCRFSLLWDMLNIRPEAKNVGIESCECFPL